MQKQFRLRKNYQFQYVYKHGKSVSNDICTIVFCTSNGRPRVGISVSNKFGGAVQRNRAKRRLREVIDRLFESMSRKHNYIFLPKQAALTEPFEKMVDETKKLLSKAGLILQ